MPRPLLLHKAQGLATRWSPDIRYNLPPLSVTRLDPECRMRLLVFELNTYHLELFPMYAPLMPALFW